MKIAVEGCAHGDIEKIYSSIELMEKKHSFKVDLLLCCGDFQSVRNRPDLECMAVPRCYRNMQSFYKYYSGELKAPILTVFIGGNHEASNYLAELPYGGWVCPNIYYLGYANVIQIGGLRIGGISGIYKGYHYLKGHFEYPPYTKDTVRSAYHIRSIDVFRLKQISEHVDIFLSHDWPRGVYNHGDLADLLRRKPFFRDDVEKDQLGSRPSAEILDTLRPDYWFSAHLHVKFSAIVKHDKEDSSKTTKFLALDKCLPRRNFLQILDIPSKEDSPLELQYDPEWLSILKSTDHLLSIADTMQYLPGLHGSERFDFNPTEEEKESVKKLFGCDLTIPLNFEQTSPAHDPSEPKPKFVQPPNAIRNPQTDQFCVKLNVRDPIQMLLAKETEQWSGGLTPAIFTKPSELEVTSSFVESPNVSQSFNPDEISLSEEDDDGGEDINEDLDVVDPVESTEDPDSSKSFLGAVPESDTQVSGSQDTFLEPIVKSCVSSGSVPDVPDHLPVPESSLDGPEVTSTGLEFVVDRVGMNPRKQFKGRNWSQYAKKDDSDSDDT